MFGSFFLPKFEGNIWSLMGLSDQFGREVDYMRIALTDRCNLRCSYCMPADGIQLAPKESILSFEELILLIEAGARKGIRKLRFTGGEPFVRKNIMTFFERVSKIDGIDSWHITTNGVLLEPHIDKLKDLGIAGINLSLDTLRLDRFQALTRRDTFNAVKSSYKALLDSGIPTKINVVLMADFNTDEIRDFCELTKESNLSIRFIEEMPFNGGSLRASKNPWSAKQISNEITKIYPNIQFVGRKVSGTSMDYQLPHAKGKIGVIPAFTRSICGDCNRIRVDAKGGLKNCLYDGGVLDLKTILRDSTLQMEEKCIELGKVLEQAVHKKPKDGFAAQKNSTRKYLQSMSHIGG